MGSFLFNFDWTMQGIFFFDACVQSVTDFEN